MSFFEYIAQHPLVGVGLAALIVLTAFVWCKAIASSKKREAEKKKIIAELEKEKALRNEFRTVNEDTFLPEKDDYRLIIGMCANVQMSIEKAEDINAAFSQLSSAKKNIYCLGYVFEDSKKSLSNFFRSNGEPLLSAAKNAVDEVLGEDFAKIFGSEFIMLDENDETTSVNEERLAELDGEFEKLMTADGEKIYALAADYIRSTKDEFLK